MKHSFSTPIAVTAFAALASASFAGTNDYFYFSDYISSNLDRVNVDPSGNMLYKSGVADASKVVTGGIKEGLDGTANTVIAVQSGGTTLARYDRTTGHFINKFGPTFGSVGEIAITPDAKYLYATDESKSTVTKIDMKTGAVAATVSGINGAHDIALGPNGEVYVAGYNNRGQGILKFDANLGSKTTFVANNYDSNGLLRPVGLAVDKNGNLWVENNVGYQNKAYGASVTYSPEAIYEFAPNGTQKNKFSSSLLQFTFGTDFGPDGNLYIAALGDFKTQAAGVNSPGNNPNYHNGIYRLDVKTGDVTPWLVTGDYSNSLKDRTPALPGVIDLVGPKYVKFESNFVPGTDPGAPVPEPASFVALGLGLLGFVVRRRK